MKKIIFSVILSLPLYAKSQDNIIQHRVLLGETLYQISRNYSVSVQSIYQLNPDINPDIIVPDQIILVPKKEISSNSTSQNSDFITHIVVAGETKFGLYRKYNVSIAELENLNPHIIPMLQVGHQLKIKTSVVTITTSDQPANTHTVVAGETLYGISRKYNITLNDLINSNRSQLTDFLRIGQILTIPSSSNVVANSSSLNQNEQYHVVQAGETKFGLSKQYNISIAKLEELNPQIISVLKAGEHIRLSEEKTVIALNPVSKPIEQTPITATQTQISNPEQEQNSEINYNTYTIQPKETLYSLSRKANMTQEEFLVLNPELSQGVKTEMQIKMPSFVNQEITIKPNYSDSYFKLEETLVKGLTKNVAFLLPFSTDEFESFKRGNNNSTNQEEFEFYSGALLAIDSLKNLGINLNYSLYHTEKEVNKLNESLKNNAIDIIFGNQKSSSLAKSSEIPFVYTSDKYDVTSQGNYIKPFATKSEQLIQLLGYLNTKNANIIVISDIEKTQDKEIISSLTPEASFSLLSDKANPDTSNLKSLLNKTKKNIILLNTSQNGLFINTTNYLLSETSDFDIQLAVVQEIPKEIAPMRLRVLKTIYVSNKYNLKATNNLSPTTAKGFDLTYDMLVRLSQEETLNDVLLAHTTQRLNHAFNYQKDQQNNYNNNKIYIYYYDTDSDAKLAQ